MTISIRASSTSMWPDCARRQAARMFPIQIREAGYELREIPASVGAAIGTGTHTAVASCLTEKMANGELGNQTADEQAGIQSLEERIRHGVRWDSCTPNLNTGTKQIIRQYRSYRIAVAPHIHPQQIETRIECTTKRGNVLSGQPDLVDHGVDDLKTGTVQRSSIAQLGAYSLLRRSQGHKVRRVREVFVQRVDVDKEQPAPREIEYDLRIAERVAANIITDIELKYAAFIESGDNLVFMANPNTMLCGSKWCPAHGTTFCSEWRRE